MLFKHYMITACIQPRHACSVIPMKDNETPEAVAGRRIRRLRQELGWSQADLAQRMCKRGFSWRQTTVTKTEAADRPLGFNEAVALADVFGTPIQVLARAPEADEAAILTRLEGVKGRADDAEREVNELRGSLAQAEDRAKRARVEIELLQAQLRQLREAGDDGEYSATI